MRRFCPQLGQNFEGRPSGNGWLQYGQLPWPGIDVRAEGDSTIGATVGAAFAGVGVSGGGAAALDRTGRAEITGVGVAGVGGRRSID